VIGRAEHPTDRLTSSTDGFNPVTTDGARSSTLTASLMALPWWRFSIYDMPSVGFDRVDECLPILEERVAELREHDTGSVVVADVVRRR
jgi:hypothetical protein